MRKKPNKAIQEAIDVLVSHNIDLSSVLKQLTKGLVERALESEMDNHLGLFSISCWLNTKHLISSQINH
ncbi:MAG: hypothetical protein EP298_00115 [Gammaproteobacteria bacterium]|nr:MAG: hypothetical protein EP298_00115 [Gammaproteobacteria bacterium]UTW42638.1 hypothetical protein KFE69_00375 [bacterium SCSIO 12844]